ncbi:hypothetical protein O181_132814 [Austropuccinia psidii MF-1]|uniref:Uncharacterized protein n=1 Tax=Austropuccinia psidii MF-1 TaxID=1389203 RepID=A0A9Q3L5K1_9BASI|nr:hypothetical protein [Austropuccinia psidii MF-1]
MAILAFFWSLGSYGPRAVVLRSMGHTPRSTVRGGYWRPPGPKFDGDHELAQSPRHPPLWPGPIDGVQGHQDHGLPKDAGEAHSDECSPKGALNLHS